MTAIDDREMLPLVQVIAAERRGGTALGRQFVSPAHDFLVFGRIRERTQRMMQNNDAAASLEQAPPFGRDAFRRLVVEKHDIVVPEPARRESQRLPLMRQ